MSAKSKFASADLSVGTINAVSKKTGGVNIFELAHRWQKKDGVIYLSVTSDGTTGSEWIDRLRKKGFLIGDYARSVLCSKKFKPTTGVTTEIAILEGELFNDSDRTTKKINVEAKRRKLKNIRVEAACLISENFSVEELKAMDISWIVFMHKLINNPDGDPSLLVADHGSRISHLFLGCETPGGKFVRSCGFAFES
jgi:hypothetical protein